MTEAPQDPAPRPARRRPSYGLPGPAQGDAPLQGDTSAQQRPAASGDPYETPGSHDDRAPYGEPTAYGESAAYGDASGHDDTASRIPPSLAARPAGRGSSAAAVGRRRSGRRRGVIPLVIGLVLLLLVAPAIFVGGIVWAMGSLVSHVDSGPAPLGGASSQVQLKANEMIVVYVPEADAAGTTCTATAENGGSLTSVPSSGSVDFGGTRYEQKLGVVAMEDATATIACTGTAVPYGIGPINLFDFAGPLLLGPVIGIVVGLAGLVTAIVGLVLLLRSRRS